MTEASGEPPVPERSDVPRRVRDPEARRTLEAWLARTGTVLSYAGWEDAGNSGAQVFAVYARRRHEGRLTDARKLVVKVLPPRASSVREPQRHARAEELSTPYFVERRLARQLPDYPPQPLGGNGWIMFQEIAGGSLTDYRSLSALMESETVGGPAIAALCGRVVESVLNEWNTPQTLGFHRGTVSDVLTGLLGPRIEEGGTLHTWARHDPGLLENPRPYLALPGESRLFPNPFALVTGPRMAGDETLSLLAGLGHGDLHPGNVVCRHRPGRAADAHRFIDLSRFSDDAPLVCDPAHFVLSIVASQLAKERAPEVRTDLARYLIDPDGHPGHDVRVGLREVIRSIHEAEKGWVENNGRGLYAEWKSHRLLAHLACALVFSGRARLRPEDRQWFFELAARAAGAYLGHQDERRTERPAGPTTVGSRGTRHIATEPGPPVVFWRTERPTAPLGYHVPRERELTAVGRLLAQREQPVIITGPPGTGKSQLALAYLDRHGGAYDFVAWLPAQREELLSQVFSDLARLCGVEAEAAAGADAVVAALGRMGSWLVVFDDADRPSAVRRHLPRPGSRFTVLITSRNPLWSQIGHQHRLGDFDRAQSTLLLTRRAEQLSVPDADRVASVLGDLPLAVDQAAQQLEGSPMSADGYVALIEKHAKDTLARGLDEDVYPASLAAVVRIAVDRLQEREPDAARLVRLTACFATAPLPFSLLDEAAELLPPVLRGAVAQAPDRLSDLVIAASRAGLVQVDRGDLHMHQLFRRLVREEWAPEVDMDRSAARRILSATDPGDPRDPGTWRTYAVLLPHVLELDLPAATDPACHRMFLRMVHFLTVSGDARTARELVLAAIERWRTEYGAEADITVSATEHLARAHVQLGDHRTAVELDRRVLEHRTRRSGAQDAETLTAEHNLAADLITLVSHTTGLYSDDGDHALRLQRDVVARRTELLGGDHRDTLLSLYNLALVLRGAGHDVEARDTHRGAYLGLARILGNDHPETLRAAHGYAVGLRDAGALTEARNLHEDTYRRRRTVLGPHHPDVLQSACSYARALGGHGDDAAAVVLLRDAHGRALTVLGQDHPDTLRYAHWLAVSLRRTGEGEESARLIEDTYRRRLRLLGESHLDTLRTASVHAAELRSAGDIDGARELERAIRRRLALLATRTA
ncbi:FxSxx-COOH system tetratricopeptide repeat protein [Streptomyces sp. NBC_00481]|uniref:FxSxx-COOH system tetratricopeptide repeat protein n=1 Tax=Streptomyces sp. NBC_00481 TaxID=2975755 RepID=UPI002DDB9666|nr:FxSxx-COOH system tetratricopeptide repeat protein [Streptomyces sp. NBC_00481]WRY93988.1 FxSxx-COOH system tetratricopeptide repeat protein [Streptomyces sp. NBC_00481]